MVLDFGCWQTCVGLRLMLNHLHRACIDHFLSGLESLGKPIRKVSEFETAHLCRLTGGPKPSDFVSSDREPVLGFQKYFVAATEVPVCQWTVQVPRSHKNTPQCSR